MSAQNKGSTGGSRQPVKNFGNKYGGGNNSGGSGGSNGSGGRVLNKSIAGPSNKAGVSSAKQKDFLQQIEDGDAIDAIFGFDRLANNAVNNGTNAGRTGWLLNYLPICMPDESGCLKSGLDLFFIDRQGGNFKCSILYEPYFYVDVISETKLLEVSRQLQKRIEGCRVDIVEKEDLDMANHLSGLKHRLIKLIFGTQEELLDAKNVIRPVAMQNSKRIKEAGVDAYLSRDSNDPFEYINDMREFDLTYPMRTSIDLNLRVGAWYLVSPPPAGTISCQIEMQRDLLELCEPRVLAFDIECEKSPLKFPNAERDRIFMISYMVAGQGFLLINRELVSEDIADFEYTPMAKYPGPFTVVNLLNEEELLKYFLKHVQTLRPHVIVTYNGDFFDWPYVQKRCDKFQLDLYKMLGIRTDRPDKGKDNIMSGGGQFVGRCMVHLDAFCWVERDSYLPQGNHGLKAVTREKLGYDPVEVDPELMVQYARDRPHHMASYSVSDAVATYYLYQSYIHNFIFSLATIIPLGPEDVLRKGSGTLCEALLMVEAYKNNIVSPNKHQDPIEQFYKGHLLDSETYIGGHVECLEAGVFRNDIPVPFKLTPAALQGLIDNIDRDLAFAVEIEQGLLRSEIANYDEVRQFIVGKLELLRDTPNRVEKPVIYHLDVGAMYPNIILTNRLQPSAMVTAADCAACDYNKAENACKRPMAWTWRGDYSPASNSEYQSLKRQLSYEKIDGKQFSEFSEKEQQKLVEKRVKQYSQKVYKKNKITTTEERVNTVCMREHGFYVDTVRAFRDRRYDYKLLTKKWKGEKSKADKQGDAVARRKAEDMEILMDSLQLAHKCILNSFYGYVMRKGARWRSMEMAGIVTHTGSQLIQQARELVEQVGRPLELDTDGIWCILPASFPQDVKIKMTDGKSFNFPYPAAMLNADVHERYTNHQYQDLVSTPGKSGKTFASRSECSIYFELDGPYKAMILPASPEEGILLKKKYVVYALDGSISELKGFEIKRRGELEIVKIFQEQAFNSFMEGDSLEGCYKSVGDVANEWLDVLDSKGINMDDTELLELISERKTISKTLDEYEDRKATALTSASRLSDFLGAEMVKDKGLNASLVISRLPLGAPVTDRAIPVAIFTAEQSVKRHYLRKWLKDPQLDENDFRAIIDWDYYKGRLAKTIQKIITIPSGMQLLDNPVPRVVHPSWLTKRLAERGAKFKQGNIVSMFGTVTKVKAIKAPVPGPKLLVSIGSPQPKTKDTPSKGHIGEFLTSSNSAELSSPSQQLITASQSPLIGTKKRDRSSSVSSQNDDNAVASSTSLSAAVAADLQPLDAIQKKTMAALASLKIEDDLQAWLKSRKDMWKSKRAANKKELSKYNDGGRSSGIISTRADAFPTTKRVLGVEEMARNASMAVRLYPWQIVEIQAMEHPGEFTFWVFNRPTELQRIRVTIPRIIYVNCRSPKAELQVKSMGGTKVQRFLPHGRPCLALYEVHVPERKFIKNEKVLNLFLADPSVEGVYESKVPLDFRALVQLGCVARLTKESNAGSSGVQKVYKFTDLEKLNGQSSRYLMPDTAIYKRIFLYHSADKSRNSGLGMAALFIVDSPQDSATSNVRGFVWWCNGANGIEVKPPMQRLYREQQPNEDFETIKFQTYSNLKTMEEVMRLVNDKLDTLLREKRGPAIVTCQGGGDRRRWRKTVPALHDTPVAIIPSNSNDELFKAINWQMDLAKIVIERYLHYGPWLNDRLERSRQGDVPLCNLGIDTETTLTDIVFARSLYAGRHLLWASDGYEPDIGGADSADGSVGSLEVAADGSTGDMNKAIDDFVNNSYDRKSKGSFQQSNESSSDGCINVPGAYRSMCVELEVYWLAVASILQANTLDAQGLLNPATSVNMSGGNSSLVGSLGGAKDSGSNNKLAVSSAFTYESSCSQAFLLLKAAVEKLKQQTSTGRFPLSNRLLNTLYRYLCGAGGKAHGLLHDPLLEKAVRGLMNKMFHKLISALKKLGAKIIYADYNRIVLFTNKHDLDSVKEYIQFIFMAISSTEGFGDLQVNPIKYWSQLLWLDRDNYGGLRAKEPALVHNLTEVIDDDMAIVESDAINQSNDVQVIRNDDSDDDKPEVSSFFKPVSSSKSVKFASSSGSPMKLTKSPAKKGSNDEYAFLDEINSSSAKSKSKGRASGSGILTTGDSGELFINGGDFEDDYDDDSDEDDGHYDDYDNYGSSNSKTRRSGKGSGSKKSSSSSKLHRGSFLDSHGEVVAHLDDSRNNDDEDEDDGRDYEDDANDDNEVEEVLKDIEYKWTLADFLKEPANIYFQDVIAAYLVEYRQKRIELKEASLDTNQAAVEEQISIDASNHMETFIKGHILTWLLDKVNELEKRFPNHSQSQSGLSELIRISNPTLDFIKFTTAILGLDSVHCDSIAALRRTLLTQIKVREFSPEGQFNSPCPSFLLRDVICIFCNNCQDVDLLRDNMYNDDTIDGQWYSAGNNTSIQAQSPGKSSSSTSKTGGSEASQVNHNVEYILNKAAKKKWICNFAGCVCEIDKSEIENRLIQQVESWSVSYLTQDFRCPRTFRASTALCVSMSEASLPLKLDFSRENFRRQLMILSLVALKHGFKMLRQVTQEMLQQQ